MTIAMANTKIRPHWTQCPDCKGWYDPYADPAFTVHGGWDHWDEKTVCVNCAQSLGWAKCTACGDWLHPDDQGRGPDCEIYCEDCWSEAWTICQACGETISSDECVCTDDGCYCDGCAPNTEEFAPDGFHNRSGCTTKTGSERCYGLELETDDCDNYWEFDDRDAWGAKGDSTVNGKEFYSDILDGDEGLAAVADLVEFAEENDWSLSSECGYHLHLDMRHENDDSLFAAAYAYRVTQELWFSLVDDARRTNNYCHKAKWDCDDLADYDGTFEQFIDNKTRDRYEWMNLRAYEKYRTFEIRLHHASLDEKEICNWIKAHTRFVDWATTLGYARLRDKFDGASLDEKLNMIACEAWQDDELRDYYTEKANAA